MKVVINNTTYTKIANIDFAPQISLIGDSIPVNSLTVDIYTTDTIGYGIPISLQNDSGVKYANFFIRSATRISDDVVRVYAESALYLLDNITLPATYYENTSFPSIVFNIFNEAQQKAGGIQLVMTDPSLTFSNINGFFSEQTARERLAELAFVSGAYIQTTFTDEFVYITKINPNAAATYIPEAKTYWRPRLVAKNPVTSIKVASYSFTPIEEENIQAVDEYVTDGSLYWVVQKQEIELRRPVATAIPENTVKFDNIMTINSMNVNSILTFLATYYFNDQTVEADIINDDLIYPGKKITINTGIGQLSITGFVEEEVFTFGRMKDKTNVKIGNTSDLQNNLHTLTVNYTYDQTILKRQTFEFPAGYIYTFSNPYIDIQYPTFRAVYYPTAKTTTGTMPNSDTTVNIPYDKALEFMNEMLYIYSVDDMEWNSETEVLSIE